MPLNTTGRTGPLDGTVVVDLTRALAGPHAAMMLGDLGADVIKVETPKGGDDTRAWGPPFISAPDAERESTYFLSANRNKRSITLDLKTDDGRLALEEIVKRADVLLENFRTGVLDRLGFSPVRLAELNPRLVVLSISGFGHDGPEGGRSGYDQIAQGEAGLMSFTGSGPDDVQRVGVPIADLLAGMYGAFGVLAALRERDTTGRGKVVRTSLLASVVGVHAFQGTKWTVAGEVGEAQGNHHPSICPYGLFPTADGAVQISVGSEGLWHRFCDGFGIDPDTEGMATNPQRVANQARRHRAGDIGLRRPRHREPAQAARRNRCSRRQSPQRPGSLRMGTDQVPRTARRRRTRHAGDCHAARTSAALLRDRRHRSHRDSASRAAGARRRRGPRSRLVEGSRVMTRMSALELLDVVVDANSFDSWDSPAVDYSVDDVYADEIAAARAKTGLDESVITGAATIRGRQVAILLCEFAFLGGSIGVAAGDRLVHAIQRATAERLPLLALPTSGGTRMQEGTVAFLQMVKITAAITAHKAAHLPYLVYLRHPTTGGVFASWGSLGHVTVAEPGALIGFLGPRVYEALYGTEFPAGVQQSENLQAHGLIDAVRPPEQLAEIVDRALRIVTDTPTCRHRVGDVPTWNDRRRARVDVGARVAA